jgi:beta-xylosidase
MRICSVRGMMAMALLATSIPLLASVHKQPWGYWQSWGDQGDGTYRNPVLPADFSDLDAIRVGSDYYAITSTLHLSPGMAVLQSKDLVNWRMIGHVVPDMTVLGPEYRWDQMKRFGRGVWAGSIRHHAGRFWVFFGTPDEGLFMSSASNPAGPWTKLHPLLEGPGWDDPAVLWDSDGKAYFLATHFADGYKSYIMPMSPDGRSIDRSKALLVNEGRGREASKLLKVGGYYYLVFSEHVAGKGRYVVARRARHPMGPWSEIEQLAEPGLAAKEPNQGGIVQVPSGRYYFLTHHGSQDWEGRAASLLPVYWREGWPIIGEPNAAGLGQMVWRGAKPIRSAAQPRLQTSDEFSAPTFSPQWEWNHQPEPGSWSLSERPGWLRLRSSRAIEPGNLSTTGSVPSQRSLRTIASAVTVKIDLSRMVDGQHAGLAHISNRFGALGVGQAQGRRTIEYREQGKTLTGPAIQGTLIWLRSEWGSAGRARYSYSLNGTRFLPFGEAYQMSRANYRGDRVGLYSFGGSGGEVDIDYFRYRHL